MGTAQAIRASTFDAARLLKAENEWGSLQRDISHAAHRRWQSRRTHQRHAQSEIVIQNGKLLDRGPEIRREERSGYRVVPGLFNP
jgi:hypothetical protein